MRRANGTGGCYGRQYSGLSILRSVRSKRMRIAYIAPYQIQVLSRGAHAFIKQAMAAKLGDAGG